MIEPGRITALLQEINSGKAGANSEFAAAVYDELREMARAQMSLERSGHTLQPTALVHETFMRLMADRNGGWDNRAHFFGSAAKAMRRILVDHARSRNSRKRTPGTPEAGLLNGKGDPDPADLIALDKALDALSRLNERQCRIVELRYFAGLSFEEIAQTLGISGRTVKRDWNFARAWLHRELSRR